MSEVDGKSGRGPRNPFIVRLDRAVLMALVGGLVLYVMPVWAEGRLRAAFWLTLIATLLHVYTSHKRGAFERGAGPVSPDHLAELDAAPGDRA